MGSFSDVLRRTVSSFVDLCLPRCCAGCGDAWLSSGEGFWCESCLRELPWIGSPLCPCCGRSYPGSSKSPDHLCSECSEGSHFDIVRSAVVHEGHARNCVHRLKFGGQLQWAPALAQLSVLTLRRLPGLNPDLIIPVPLHRERLRERGFNQSAMIARWVSGETGIPVGYDVLLRTVRTAPQTRLARTERLKNVKGAFAVPSQVDVRGASILLLDDVFTTGTTIRECAKTLKRKGAAFVSAITVTRALVD